MSLKVITSSSKGKCPKNIYNLVLNSKLTKKFGRYPSVYRKMAQFRIEKLCYLSV